MRRSLLIAAGFTLTFIVGACSAKREAGDLTVAELFERAREFDGKRVAVIGFYVSSMEESALYVAPDAQDELDDVFWKRIWVNPGWRSASHLTDRQVRVVGIFHYRPDAERRIEQRDDGREFQSAIPHGYGHMAVYPAELSDVRSFRRLR